MTTSTLTDSNSDNAARPYRTLPMRQRLGSPHHSPPQLHPDAVRRGSRSHEGEEGIKGVNKETAIGGV